MTSESWEAFFVIEPFMHPAFHHIGHRPWPLPQKPWFWRQSWLDLAFIHHRVEATNLEALLPAGVELERFDGTAWIGLVPFRMAGVMRRPLPDLPFLSTFPELNVRTYVTVDGKPGVWFFSLDAASRTVVFGGRNFYNLPYHVARMRHRETEGWYAFSSLRCRDGARFEARFRPQGEPFFAELGTFEHWATERYCLYSHSPRGLARVEVHHAPWPLQRVEMISEGNLLEPLGIEVLPGEPVCHFSSGVHVVSYGREWLARNPSIA